MLLFLLACAMLAAAPLRKTLDVGGHPRVYLVDVPAGDDSRKPLPLVLVFHGGAVGSAAKGTYGF